MQALNLEAEFICHVTPFYLDRWEMGLGRRRKEAIADTADGLQMDGLRGIIFDVAAQANDEVVDSAGVGVFTHAPYLLQQLLARDDAALVAHQIAEQIRLHDGETDIASRGTQFERGEVDGAIVESKD